MANGDDSIAEHYSGDGVLGWGQFQVVDDHRHDHLAARGDGVLSGSVLAMLGNQNSGFRKPCDQLSEPADSDSASFGHVGNGFDAASALLVFLVSLAAANMGNDSFGGQ